MEGSLLCDHFRGTAFAPLYTDAGVDLTSEIGLLASGCAYLQRRQPIRTLCVSLYRRSLLQLGALDALDALFGDFESRLNSVVGGLGLLLGDHSTASVPTIPLETFETALYLVCIISATAQGITRLPACPHCEWPASLSSADYTLVRVCQAFPLLSHGILVVCFLRRTCFLTASIEGTQPPRTLHPRARRL